MFKRIPSFALWIFLAAAVAVLPMACGGDDDNNGGTDASPMTGS